MFAFRNLAVILCLGNDLLKIITDCFRKAGGVDSDQVRFIDHKDVVDRRHEICLPSEYRSAFRERACCSHDRFLVMAGQGAAMIRAAPL